MHDDILNRIEETLNGAPAMTDETRDTLRELLGELRGELKGLSEQDRERATTLADLAANGTAAAAEDETDVDALTSAVDGLNNEVNEMQASHPQLARILNGICIALSNSGI